MLQRSWGVAVIDRVGREAFAAPVGDPARLLARLSSDERLEAVEAFRGLLSILREWDKEVSHRNVDRDCRYV